MVDYEIWDYPMANIKYDHKIIFNSCNTETLEQINLKVSFIATLFHTFKLVSDRFPYSKIWYRDYFKSMWKILSIIIP